MRRDSGLETREALIESAIENFAEVGFKAASVQSIVEGASATKGAFYHHFQSKNDVLVAIHTRFIERQLSTLEQIVNQGLPCSTTLALMIEALIAQHDTHGRELAIVNRERQAIRSPEFESIRKLRDQVEQMIDDVIVRGIDAKEFRPVPSVRVVAFAVLGVTAWLYQWYTPSGTMPAREIGRLYAVVLLDGLRGTEPITESFLRGDSALFAERIAQGHTRPTP